MKRLYLLSFFFICLTANATVDFDRILEMGTWSKTELEELVVPGTYENVVATLRSQLTASVENSSNQWSLDRNDSKQLASAFIAYTLIYVYPISKTLPVEVAESFGNAADVAWEAVGFIIREEFGRPFMRSFKTLGRTALRAAMITLGIDDENPSALKLYSALWLSYANQLMASDYFNQAFIRAMAEFSSVDLARTSNEIIERVAFATWQNDNLKNVSEIVLLRKLMTSE